MTDETIIRLFEERNEQAITEAKAAYGSRLQRLADSILQDEQAAEECVSDTYWAAWRSIPPQKPNRLFCYLAKICRHAAFAKLDWQKAEKRRAVVVELTREMEECVPAEGHRIQLEEESLGKAISCFLQSQPKQARIIFLRRYWFGDSVREISKRLSLGEGAVKTSLYRTRKKLKDFLQEEGMDV